MSNIEWTDKTWNVVRGCRPVSPGCINCFAKYQARRTHGPGGAYENLTVLNEAGVQWTGEARFIPSKLDVPLRRRKPTTYFVNSMSDLFHEDVSDKQLAAVFGVMAACPHHTFQVLTKRAERMRDWLSADGRASHVEGMKHLALAGRIAEYFADERRAPISGFDGYLVSSRGHVFSTRGAARCPWCGDDVGGSARRKWCSSECKQRAHYEQSRGRWSEPESEPRLMSYDRGEMGHCRVTLYDDAGCAGRHLIHRLVLEAFDRAPRDGEQGRHLNGNPENNALWNLKWGSQSDNWGDRKRHGNGRSWSKLGEAQVRSIRRLHRKGWTAADIAERHSISDTQVLNIVKGRQWVEPEVMKWPLPRVWLGVSVEDQQRADERIPLLMQTMASVRFLSVEPLLEDVRLNWPLSAEWKCDRCSLLTYTNVIDVSAGTVGVDTRLKRVECMNGCGLMRQATPLDHLNWVIVGGESGPGARRFDVRWARSIVEQCRAARVPCFVKQLGAVVVDRNDAFQFDEPGEDDHWPPDTCDLNIEHNINGYRDDHQGADCRIHLVNKKGGDMDEWPADLRVREMPEVRR